MLDEILQDRAALYVSGDMPAEERDALEVLIEYHVELRAHVWALREVTAGLVLAHRPRAGMAPPAGLRARILGAARLLTGAAEPDALVVAGPDELVVWVNPAFTTLCGYSLDELRGRKPGGLLQGPRTDRAAVGRMRDAIRSRRACRETVANYRKDGSEYFADIRIMPILDDAGEPLFFVARERRVPGTSPSPAAA